MASEQEVKAVKGKLYNLKSGIEGLLPLIDAGILQPEQVGGALTTLTVKTVDELTAQLGNGG